MADLSKQFHDVEWELQNYIRGLDTKSQAFSQIKSILGKIKSLRREVTESPGLNSACYPDTDAEHTGMHNQILSLRQYLSDVKRHRTDLLNESKSSPTLHGMSLKQIDEYIVALEQVIDGWRPAEPGDLTGGTDTQRLVLHEMEIWEVQYDKQYGEVLVQDDLRRVGVDLETDTFPLSIEAISYSRLFGEHLTDFFEKHRRFVLAETDVIRDEVLKRWAHCMHGLQEKNPVSSDEAYRHCVKFLEEVGEAIGRMQSILVQDVAIFKPMTAI